MCVEGVLFGKRKSRIVLRVFAEQFIKRFLQDLENYNGIHMYVGGLVWACAEN